MTQGSRRHDPGDSVDRSRSPALTAREERRSPLRIRARAALRARRGHAPRRRPDALDGAVGRRLPGLPGPRRRAPGSSTSTGTSTSTSASATPARWPGTRRRRPSRRSPSRRARGITTMLPTEDAIVGGRGADAPLRAAALAVRPDRDGRQPLRAPARARDHRPAEDPGLQLLLPRHRRRDLRDARRRPRRRQAGQRRPAGRPGADDQGRRS